MPLGEGIVGSVARTGQAERINDVCRRPSLARRLGPQFATQAILAVPLVARGRVIGVLQLLNPVGRQGFTAGDLRRMQLFAGPLANALENARLYAAQKRQFVEIVTALAEAIEKRDPYTGGHVRRVVGYSLLLAEDMGLPLEELERIHLSATLHDVGKIAVPDLVLRKPAPLDAAEMEVMRRHTVDGAEIVASHRVTCGECSPACAATTSGWTARAIPTASRAPRSRRCRASSRSPTPSTP